MDKTRPTYEELLHAVERLTQENAALKRRVLELGGKLEEPNTEAKVSKPPLLQLSLDEKVELFRSLFKGREDVFARRWYSEKAQKGGYQPVCLNEWRYGVCDKRKVKCADCPNRQLKPLDNQDVFNHLAGKDANGRDVIGLYPILEDNTCHFLCADFDDKTCKHGFKDDVLAYVGVAEDWGAPCYIERSRSGNGAHVWIFFEEPVLALKARKLGNALLSEAMTRRRQMELNSYDRLFPNQDTLTDGGFGNLVALPLQGMARKNHNSVFVDKDFNEIYDQWAYLKDMQRLGEAKLNALIVRHAAQTTMGEFSKSSESKPWEVPVAQTLSHNDFSPSITLVRANMLYIALHDVSAKVVNHLKRIAAFKNPYFYAKRAMHLSTYNVPRIISCSEITDEYIGLPRGCEDAVTDLLDEYNIDFSIDDMTNEGTAIDVNFKGELRPEQEDAVAALTVYNNGILHATTAFGKTVAAIGLIAKRKVSTLILVHTKALLDQWKARLEGFIEIDFTEEDEPKKRGRKKKFSPFGTLDSTGNSLHGRIDIALIQSCLEDSESGVRSFVKDYGMVIIDECHHVPAANFELVLRQINARYVYGLTATPTRKDGHQPIIYMQCGPIRYVADAQQQIASQNFSRILTPRFTSFRIMNNEHADFTLLCDKITEDEQRNNLIVEDAIATIRQGRTPIILSSRTKHVLLLANLLKDRCPDAEVVALLGSEKTKEKRQKMELLSKHPVTAPLAIVAIDKYVGEGFDYPRLDTLLLAMPFSHKARVAQYAGRLHRDYEGKTEVRVLDYVDIHVSLAEKMYRRRLKGYAAIGYNRPSKNGEQLKEAQFIFSCDNYFDAYLADIRNAQKSIVISMPKIWLPAFAPFLDVLAEKQTEGAEIAVFTTEENGTVLLRNKGIPVMMSENATIPCAIIDNKLLWYGSVNYLARNHSDDYAIRIESSTLVPEVLDLLLK